MASKKEVTGWYAELLWVDGIIKAVLEDEDIEMDEDIGNKLYYCRKRLNNLKLNMMKEGMKNVSERQIISTFNARAPSSFKFTSE